MERADLRSFPRALLSFRYIEVGGPPFELTRPVLEGCFGDNDQVRAGDRELVFEVCNERWFGVFFRDPGDVN